MTDTTNLGTIWVVGQRRTPGGSFPPPGGSAGGGVPDTPGHTIHQAGDDPEPPPATDPCAHPDTAREWNADAAAAEAKREFERRAAELNDAGLSTREWHAYLYQRADGSIYLGVITHGDPMTGTVNADDTGMTPDNLIGWVHNHPGGSPNPSGDDWTKFDVLSTWISTYSNTARSDQLRAYVIAPSITQPGSPWTIRVFDGQSNRNFDAPAPEVNPEAQPCP